jgi:MFS family permease
MKGDDDDASNILSQTQLDEQQDNNNNNIEPQHGKVLQVDQIIEQCGFGVFQLLLLVFCGCIWMTDCMEIVQVSLLLPELQKEWQLSPFIKGVIGSVIFMGMLIGTFVFGYVSDRYGRKTSLLIYCLGTGIFSFLSAASTNWIFYAVTRGITGFCIGGAQVAYCYFSEFVPTRHRSSLIGIGLFWVVGVVLQAGLAWIFIPLHQVQIGTFTLKSWRLLLIITACPLILLAVVCPFVPESPRYLLLRGDKKQAEIVVRKIAKVNRVAIDGQLDLSEAEITEETPSSVSTLTSLFSRQYIRVTLLMTALWFLVSMGYYGVLVLTPDYFSLKGDGPNSEYLPIFLTSAAELPGNLIALAIVNRAGRRITCGIMFLICGLFMFPLLLDIHVAFLTSAAVIVRMAISGAFATVTVMTPEMYPTAVRSMGLGLNSSSSKIAAIIAPFISSFLFDIANAAPVIIYSINCFIAVVLLYFIPETANVHLADTV